MPAVTGAAHLAIVTTASPLTVTIIGTSVAAPAKHLDSYTPTLNDLVAYIQLDPSKDGAADLLVLGVPM